MKKKLSTLKRKINHYLLRDVVEYSGDYPKWEDAERVAEGYDSNAIF